MTDRTPADIIGDENATPTERVVARCYIRRLIITPEHVDEGLATTADAGVDDDDREAVLLAFLMMISPYGLWMRDKSQPYPVPEATFNGWDQARTVCRDELGGLPPQVKRERLAAMFGPGAPLAKHLARKGHR
ncbi:hypothetical protein [Agromyces sp. SYSU T00194]|uniref:hypothetical protein n=1 Tax=Agromyces chitinivorans TaxID=3158560 RepID=UPI0033982C61